MDEVRKRQVEDARSMNNISRLPYILFHIRVYNSVYSSFFKKKQLPRSHFLVHNYSGLK